MKQSIFILFMLALMLITFDNKFDGVSTGNIEIDEYIVEAINEQMLLGNASTIGVHRIEIGNVTSRGVTVPAIIARTNKGTFFTISENPQVLQDRLQKKDSAEKYYVMYPVPLPEGVLYDGARNTVSAICLAKGNDSECYRSELATGIETLSAYFQYRSLRI